MAFNKYYQMILLIVIGSILIIPLPTNTTLAAEGKASDNQMVNALQKQIDILKEKVEKIDNFQAVNNNNHIIQANQILSVSSDTVKYVGIIASLILTVIIILLGYQMIKSYQFEQELKEFRDLRKLMMDEYDKMLKIRSDAEHFMDETKSKMGNLGDFVGDLATKYLMGKTTELIREEKEEREKTFEAVKTQVSEVKTTIEDEKERNIELMNKLEALDLTLTPTVYIERGSIYLDQRNYTKAIENFNAAISLKGSEKRAYLLRASAYGRMKDYDNAIKDYLILTKIDPSNPVVFVEFGMCYLEKKEYDQAIKHLSKAIELDPKMHFAYFKKAHVYYSWGKHDLAINELKEAVKISTNNSRYLSALGIEYEKIGDYKSAIEYYLKSIAIKKTSNTVLNLAEAYICDKNYTEAEKSANDGYSIASTERDKAMAKYILLMALILNNKEYRLELKEFVEKVRSITNFDLGEWSFEEILDCLKKDAEMSNRVGVLVNKIIGFLKGEVKGEDLLS